MVSKKYHEFEYCVCFFSNICDFLQRIFEIYGWKKVMHVLSRSHVMCMRGEVLPLLPTFYQKRSRTPSCCDNSDCAFVDALIATKHVADFHDQQNPDKVQIPCSSPAHLLLYLKTAASPFWLVYDTNTLEYDQHSLLHAILWRLFYSLHQSPFLLDELNLTCLLEWHASIYIYCSLNLVHRTLLVISLWTSLFYCPTHASESHIRFCGWILDNTFDWPSQEQGIDRHLVNHKRSTLIIMHDGSIDIPVHIIISCNNQTDFVRHTYNLIMKGIFIEDASNLSIWHDEGL